MASTVPGPPAAVLAAIIRADSSHPYDGTSLLQRRTATFSASPSFPDLPSLTNDVVFLPQNATLDANVSVTGTLTSQGWGTAGVVTVTAAYTASSSDAVILADATAGAFTVTLPDATQPGFTAGQRYTVKKTDPGANPVTLAASAGQLIDGAATQAVTPAQSAISVVFNSVTPGWAVTSGGSAIGTNSVGGVTVSGTPSTGQFLIAASSTAANWQVPSAYAPTGKTGAAATSEYAGATTSGPPVSGTFAGGDFILDRTGLFWICTAAGTPGTWVTAGLPLTGGTLSGSLTLSGIASLTAGGGVDCGVGNLRLGWPGTGVLVAEGSNCKQGTVALVSGSKVVANTSVTANSRIFLTSQADGGTPGWLRVSARTAGTSFTITSSSGTDTSTVAFEIFEPA